MVRYCAECGTPLKEGHAFCENCGAPASLQEAPVTNGASTVPVEAPIGPIFNAGLPKKASGMAIASLVLGIISVVTCAFVIGVFFGIAAIILFAVARKKHGGTGVGLAGMITGVVGTVLSIAIAIGIAVAVTLFSNANVQVNPPSDDPSVPSFSTEHLSEANLIGTWYLIGADIPSSEEGDYRRSVLTYEEAQALGNAGSSATLTFNKNETFVLEYNGTTLRGEWDVDEYHADLDFNGVESDMFVYFYNNGSEVDPYTDSSFNQLGVVDSSSAVFDFER